MVNNKTNPKEYKQLKQKNSKSENDKFRKSYFGFYDDIKSHTNGVEDW